jgi:uncharacterized membrane protein HdeD (DUF308 family)
LENGPSKSGVSDDATIEVVALEPRDSPKWRNGIGIAAIVLALLALIAPLSRVEVQGRIGLLLVLAAVLEIAHGFRRSTAAGQRAAWLSGGVTLGMGALLIHAPFFATTALVFFLAAWFGLDGIRYLIGTFRHRDARRSALAWIFAGLGNLLMCTVLLAVRGEAIDWTVAIAGAVRIFAVAWNIFLSPVFTAGDSGDVLAGALGLPDDPEVHKLARRLADEESARAAIDRGWIVGFIATLFAIHIARMGFDRTFLGIMSPGIAVIGDVFLGLLLAFAVVIPLRLLLLRLTRGLELRAWSWCLAVPEEHRGWGRRLTRAGLARRLRTAIRFRQARYSFRTAVSRGLQTGLPLAAIIAATVPIWGISWYFDTENWAAGVWNSWAEERTDTWREAMVRAVLAREPNGDPTHAFAVTPEGVTDGKDFAFIVIGDTGEGDASQHSLRASYLDVVRNENVKFVVISSDVVYPTGAMRNYEANFWLPFMGTAKPVYAIPGNHDWYDALEGFAATFLEPGAARAVMRARIEVDNRLTSTTDQRIEELIAQASQLRTEYGVPTQQQEAPFFQIQTDTFALVAVDTGVVRGVDPVQMEWLKRALHAARGKTKMAILGHPFYAGGHYLAEDNPDFAALHNLLREHEVAIVMAGDTHDLEYYAEKQNDSKTSHHFVNGGGGAYLSFGTALAWPEKPATADWAYYPAKAQVVAKIEATAPLWKAPAWWWTKQFGAWPFSAEGLSAAFDVNVAPFYQSFLVVHVAPSSCRIRIVPHGVHGRLRWSDMDRSPDTLPAGAAPDSLAEWEVKMFSEDKSQGVGRSN